MRKMKRCVAIILSMVLTFSMSMAALKAMKVGEGATKTLGTLLIGALGGPVYFKFDTHCVNRGNMYGDPMYDYVVDDVRMTY